MGGLIVRAALYQGDIYPRRLLTGGLWFGGFCPEAFCGGLLTGYAYKKYIKITHLMCFKLNRSNMNSSEMYTEIYKKNICTKIADEKK